MASKPVEIQGFIPARMPTPVDTVVLNFSDPMLVGAAPVFSRFEVCGVNHQGIVEGFVWMKPGSQVRDAFTGRPRPANACEPVAAAPYNPTGAAGTWLWLEDLQRLIDAAVAAQKDKEGVTPAVPHLSMVPPAKGK